MAEVYKQRWQIELFFKALKQNLRLKTFIGTSANALKTQVWAALIAMLLIKYLQLKATFGWSLSNLVALLRQQLFVYRDRGYPLHSSNFCAAAEPSPVTMPRYVTGGVAMACSASRWNSKPRACAVRRLKRKVNSSR